MSPEDRRLRRHLAIAVVLKLAFLGLLWWMFVRDAGVHLDPERVAAQIGVSASSQGATR